MAGLGGLARMTFVRVCASAEEAVAIRARATEHGETAAGWLRRMALMAPRLPERARVVGVDAMDAAGSELGRALRDEDGLGADDVYALFRRLHARVMELRIEWTLEAPPKGLYRWRGRHGGRDGGEPQTTGFTIRFTETEVARVKEYADACRLPVSTYVKRRALGVPLAPKAHAVEGLAAVDRCTALLWHAAKRSEAGRGALALQREAENVRRALYEEARRDH